ncbi:MAG: hypothetical protein Q9163_003221 [Psora crenata]
MDDTASIKSSSQAATTASTGTKRKRSSDPKFYAVRVGRRPGVYSTWADCIKQVKGFKKALFKSFPTLRDAERFVAGEDPSQSGSSGLSPTTKFYAVRSGRVPGIYTDWPSAQEQITGWQKPKHRCFTSRAEAQRFLDEDGSKSEASSIAPQEDNPSFFTFNDAAGPLHSPVPSSSRKKAKKPVNGSHKAKQELTEYIEPYEPGTGPLPPGAVDGFDPNIMLDPQTGQLVYKTQEQRQATKPGPTGGSLTGPIRVHTDGSSLGNGTAGAFAGIGVYFGPRDKRNVSEMLPGARQTNQRAELAAILRALEMVPRNRDVVIITDSRYSIDCVTNWHVNWRRNGWKNTAGKAVENRDIIENVLAKIQERDGLGVQTDFEWIKGHSTCEGNIQADKLATVALAQQVHFVSKRTETWRPVEPTCLKSALSIMPTLDISNFNIVCGEKSAFQSYMEAFADDQLLATIGGFVTVFALVSYLFKERFYLSEALISLLAGITFSHGAEFIKPLEYTNGSEEDLDSVTLYFTRLVLGVQLVLAGVQLPSKYLQKEWRSLALLLGPGMTVMWLSSSLIVWGMVPNLSFLHAMAVGACVTPTDPVLSNTIVKGKFADKNIPRELQRIIIAESGANDGLGYPFLFLPLYIIKYTGSGGQSGGAGMAMRQWFGETWGYTILLSVLYGALVGWIAKELLHWAEKRRYVDRESFLVFAITLALFITGTCGMIGSDDVLACFVAGNAFTIDDWFRLETLDDSLQPTIDMLLNLSIFMWFGAVCPWASFAHNDVIPIYRLIFLGVLILLFRRIPVIFALHWNISQIRHKRQALFVGFFGPIGVSAVFYLYISLGFLRQIAKDGHTREDAARLEDIFTVVIWFLAVCSIVVHGLSIPLGKLGYHLPRTLSSAAVSRSISEDPTEPAPFHLPQRSVNDYQSSPPTPRQRSEQRSRQEPPRPVFRIGGSIIESDTENPVATPSNGSKVPAEWQGLQPLNSSAVGINHPRSEVDVESQKDVAPASDKLSIADAVEIATFFKPESRPCYIYVPLAGPIPKTEIIFSAGTRYLIMRLDGNSWTEWSTPDPLPPSHQTPQGDSFLWSSVHMGMTEAEDLLEARGIHKRWAVVSVYETNVPTKQVYYHFFDPSDPYTFVRVGTQTKDVIVEAIRSNLVAFQLANVSTS